MTTIVLINFNAPVVDPADPPIKIRKNITVCERWGQDAKSSVENPVVVKSDTVVNNPCLNAFNSNP